MGAQDLFLILDNRVLIPKDARLIAHQFGQEVLMLEDSLLIADDRALVSNDRVLFLDGCLRHCGIPCSCGVDEALSTNNNGDGTAVTASVGLPLAGRRYWRMMSRKS